MAGRGEGPPELLSPLSQPPPVQGAAGAQAAAAAAAARGAEARATTKTAAGAGARPAAAAEATPGGATVAAVHGPGHDHHVKLDLADVAALFRSIDLDENGKVSQESVGGGGGR
jgi:hypothetical protein